MRIKISQSKTSASCSKNIAFALPLLLIVGLLAGCESRPQEMPSSATSYLDAQKHFAAGETQQALEAVNASIEQEPSPWAYLLRARLHLQQGNESDALRDCEAGLQLEPNDPGLTWFKTELAKPAAARFQGQFKDPPSVDR
jgi:Tfp pilus assembly protein PilF